MSLPVPSLDDRRYADLLDEALARIPAVSPSWTDHNASDPGITLLELFAWLTEMLVFRADQITDEQRIGFLRLLSAADWDRWRWNPDWDVDDQVRLSLARLRDVERAVTAADYELLARRASADVARSHAVPRRELATGRDVDRPGSISVIVVPRVDETVLAERSTGFEDLSAALVRTNPRPLSLPLAAGDRLYLGATARFVRVDLVLEPPALGYDLAFETFDGGGWTSVAVVDGTNGLRSSGRIELTLPSSWSPVAVGGVTRFWLRVSVKAGSAAASPAGVRRVALRTYPEPDASLLQTVYDDLAPRRVLTTRHQVVGPRYVDVGVELVVARRRDTPDDVLRGQLTAAIEDFLAPLSAGEDGTGWPFGRPVYVSELAAQLEPLPGVDFLPDVRLIVPDPELIGSAAEIWNDEGEQVGLDLGAHTLPRAATDGARIHTSTAFVPLVVAVTATPRAAVSARDARRAVREAVRTHFHPDVLVRDSGGLWAETVDDLRVAIANAATASANVIALDVTGDDAHLTRTPAGARQIVLGEGELPDVRTALELA